MSWVLFPKGVLPKFTTNTSNTAKGIGEKLTEAKDAGQNGQYKVLKVKLQAQGIVHSQLET